MKMGGVVIGIEASVLGAQFLQMLFYAIDCVKIAAMSEQKDQRSG